MAMCAQCGQREADKNSHLCKLCLAGAPVSYAPKPGVYAGSAAASFASGGGGTSSSPAPAAKQEPPPEPVQQADAPASEPKPAKKPRPARESTGERSLFAVLGFILAFFHPLCGLAVSIAGAFESKKTGTGLVISIFGILVSIVIIAAFAFLLVNGTLKELIESLANLF